MCMAALATPFFLSACSDDYEYSPGEEVAADCPNVYFSNSNSNLIEVKSDDPSVSVVLQRENTSGQLTVPIVVESVTGDITIPESVTFADGAATTNLVATYSEYQIGMKFTVSIPDEYVNPYLKVDGASSFTASLTQVNKVCDVTYGSTTYPSRFDKVTTSAIYNYSGENRFIWMDFLGSGKNLIFRVDVTTQGGEFDMNDLTKLKGDIIPMNYTYKDDYGFHFVEDGSESEDDYITWTPEGQTEPVTSFYYYGYYGGSSYSYIEFDPGSYGCGYGFFWSAYVNGAGYENIYFYLYY